MRDIQDFLVLDIHLQFEVFDVIKSFLPEKDNCFLLTGFES